MGRLINIHYDNKPLYNINIEQDFSGLYAVFESLGLKNRKICILTDSTVGGHYLDTVMDIARECTSKAVSYTFEAGEKSKNLDTIEDFYEQLVTGHFDRNDVIAALGGGVTGDMAGFAAATYLRGIRVVQIPSSLLAMVDSSIGGKTGVDFRGYKNMVGAFHQPSAVYINVSMLSTLTDEQYYSGFGEVVKHGIIRDAGYLDYIKNNYKGINGRDFSVLEEIVAGSCNIKRAVVENDPEEKGERAILNFGHTLGHAIEKLKDFSMLHGECVSIGIAAAAYISMRRGMLMQEEYNSICQVLKELELPIKTDGLKAEDIINISKSDKKMDAGKIKFILLNGMGNAVICNDVTDSEMLEALNTVLE
ncbi:MAG: 3-dehydroquinate synthase [Lachnospiraceae bacterium]|nr:3-dehydroquinate synthase [Lachnospiraceae bacterium]